MLPLETQVVMSGDGGSDPWTPVKLLHCPSQPVALQAQSNPKTLTFPWQQEQKPWRSWILQLKLSHLSSENRVLSVQSPRGPFVYLNLSPTFGVCKPELEIYQTREHAWHFQPVLLWTWPETSAYQTCLQFSGVSTLGHSESKEMQSRPNNNNKIPNFLRISEGAWFKSSLRQIKVHPVHFITVCLLIISF